jgi:branched-chain amino acid transport system permease protein
VFFPEASNTVIFVIMAIVLLIGPPACSDGAPEWHAARTADRAAVRASRSETIAFLVMVAAAVVAPFFIYPLFLMQALCFALFACAFNLLIGYVGLLSFGHALYFGWASYLAAHSAKVWGFPPELAILTGARPARPRLVAGSLAIRRQGIYFAMITLALAQMMFFFALQAKFTGGEDGIQAVPRGSCSARST